MAAWQSLLRSAERFYFTGHEILEVTGDSRLRTTTFLSSGSSRQTARRRRSAQPSACARTPLSSSLLGMSSRNSSRRTRGNWRGAPQLSWRFLRTGADRSCRWQGSAPSSTSVMWCTTGHQFRTGPSGWGLPASPRRVTSSTSPCSCSPSVRLHGGLFTPNRLGISFGLPDPEDWTYAFGYPELAAEIETDENANNGLRVTRVLKRSAGHVEEPFPDGPDDATGCRSIVSSEPPDAAGHERRPRPHR